VGFQLVSLSRTPFYRIKYSCFDAQYYFHMTQSAIMKSMSQSYEIFAPIDGLHYLLILKTPKSITICNGRLGITILRRWTKKKYSEDPMHSILTNSSLKLLIFLRRYSKNILGILVNSSMALEHQELSYTNPFAHSSTKNYMFYHPNKVTRYQEFTSILLMLP